MRIETDPDLCVSSGQCVLSAPEVFDQDEDNGTVDLLIERPEPRLRESVVEASRRCPVQAIVVFDE